MRFRLVVDGEEREIEIDKGPKGLTVRVDGAVYRGTVRAAKGEIAVRIGSRPRRIHFEGQDAIVDAARHRIGVIDVLAAGTGTARDETVESPTAEVRPPMPGRVVRVLVSPGDRVRRGETLLVLEAMKMQNEIPAPRAGVVRRLDVSEGETITADRIVAVLDVR